MKKTRYILSALLGMCLTANAQTSKQSIVDGVSVSDVSLQRNGTYMEVDMTLDLTNLDVSSNRAVLLTPRLIHGSDSLDLQSIGVYGRRRYFYYVRNGKSMLSENEQSYRNGEKPDTLQYHYINTYSPWMDGAYLSLHRSDYGCCNKVIAEQDGMLARYLEPFTPQLVYVRPKAETSKSRSLEGSAFIDFPVNKTVIYPDYRRNTAELGKIQATIDSVKNDRDITITSVWLKGYASPESPYAHNKKLAIGRTQALKDYIQQLYKFGSNIIQTDYEPEDWAGLRRYVENSNIDNRTEILALIDSNMDPDEKEAKIKKTYPEQYKFLLENCYPALRHTDYRIAYDIREFSDVEEIKRLVHTQPQKLSLNEFYLVAQEYESGTPEFAEVFETAVRLYPNDEIANLNAANAEISRGDYGKAARYLNRAGDSTEAIYARGVLAYYTEDMDAARSYLNQAKDKGLPQAAEMLEKMAR